MVTCPHKKMALCDVCSKLKPVWIFTYDRGYLWADTSKPVVFVGGGIRPLKV